MTNHPSPHSSASTPRPRTFNGPSDVLGDVSASLKIGRISVKLYAIVYLNPADGARGGTLREYVAWFSAHATEIPIAFDAVLRMMTFRRPERYRALVARLRVHVLEPARLRAQARQRQQQRDHLMELPTFARQPLGAADVEPDSESHLAHPSMRQGLNLLVERIPK